MSDFMDTSPEPDMKILRAAQSGDIFVSTIGFSEDGIEMSYIEASKQSDKIMTSQNIFISAEDLQVQSAYAEFQEICGILIRDAFSELRS